MHVHLSLLQNMIKQGLGLYFCKKKYSIKLPQFKLSENVDNLIKTVIL